MKLQYIILGIISILIISCGNDPTPESTGRAYENGYFVLNEGPFNIGTGSVSYLDEGKTIMYNQTYQYANGTDHVVGNILQSGVINNNLLFMVVNNSHHIIAATRDSLKFKYIVDEGLNNPRYLAFSQGKGFVTNWGDPSDPNDDYIGILDINAQTMTQNISVGEGPEQMIVDGGKIYVNHTGGWNYNNIVSVLDVANNAIETTITVGDVPNSMVLANGYLYVLCGGKPSYADAETEASLYKIDLQNYTATEVCDLASFTSGIDHASNLLFENNSFYLNINGAYYRLGIDESVNFAQMFIDEDFYKAYWIDETFYGMDAGDFNSSGYVKLYNSAGAYQNEFLAGVVPSMVVKNE